MDNVYNNGAAAPRRSNKTVLGYCFVVGLGAILFGLDQGETTGFLAMQRYEACDHAMKQ